MRRVHRASLLTLLLSTPAAAVPLEQGLFRIAVEANGGVTSFAGDLSSKRTAPTYGLSLTVGQVPWEKSSAATTLGGLASFWSLNINSIDSRSKSKTAFPFRPNTGFNVFATSFSPTICALADYAVQACIGVGWEEFDVHQASENEQMYGTTMWSLAIGRFLDDALHAGLKVNYRRVDQTVDGKKSNFAATSLLFSLGWQFRS